ncbi:MAG: ATP-binding protein [Pseudomonadota bacterium]
MFPLRRLAAIFAFLCVVAAIAFGVWRYGYYQALGQLARQGEADLALASDRLVGQLERYRELAVLIADHPILEDLAAGREADKASLVFREMADQTGALNILFVDVNGLVQAAAGGATGADLNNISYVRRAAQGALGWGHAEGRPARGRAFYHAAPGFDPDGHVIGSIVVAASIPAIEDEWRGGFRPVFFTDAAGEVFVTNRSELVGRTRREGEAGLISQDGHQGAFGRYHRGTHEVWQMEWGPYLPKNALHLARDLPIIGLTGETLVDVAPARRLAGLQSAAVAALCLAFGAILFLVTERRRALALANAELEVRVVHRTRALSEANAALRREAAEREEAQAALAQAQSDLLQAGKLSALGQMSAGISHELNQPLMAIRSFAENAVEFHARGQEHRITENLGRISDMARRMGRIIQNLRAFSKQEAEPMTQVDLIAVLEQAREMVAGRAERLGLRQTFETPEGPVWVRGGEVRLGQVFVNLMTNALDAIGDRDDPHLSVRVIVTNPVRVEVQDNGPGVVAPEKVFDPFYSTKEVGASEGMGLGLSISYGIAKSFGGDIKVRNCNPGALFIVELQPVALQEVA